MKFIKIIILIIWVISTAFFVLVFLTPLEFTSKYLLFASFLIAFNGAYHFSFLLTNFISLKWNKVMMGILLSLTLLFGIYYFPGLNPQYESTEILFRERQDPSVYIASQKEESKDGLVNQRLIKVIPIPPFFNWVTDVKTIVNMDETQWEKVEE